MVDVVRIELTMPEGAGLQSARDPYTTIHPIKVDTVAKRLFAVLDHHYVLSSTCCLDYN